MDNQDALIDVRKMRSLFTDSEWTVMSYIAKHPAEVVGMNIGTLAKLTYSTNGTIIRVARKLGCNGFRALKIRLSQELESRRHLAGTVDFAAPFSVGESTERIARDMGSLYRNALVYLESTLDLDACSSMVQKLLDAEKLYFFATGDSQITLDSFRNKLIKLSIMAYDAMELGDEEAVCQSAREGDVALIVSYSGENERIAGCIPILKQHGSSILALTAMPESTCAEASDEFLAIPELEGDKGQKYATFYSQFAFGYVLNLLYALIYSEMHKQA